MAKKRKDLQVDLSSTSSFGELFQAELNKLCDFEAPDPVLCSTGSSLLDTIIGGGLSTGKYHVFAAPAHSGKSTTCIRTIAKFLEDHQDGIVLWIDGEQASPPLRLMQLGIPFVHAKDKDGQDIVDPKTGFLPKLNSKGDIVWDNRFFRVPNNITLETAFELVEKCIQIKIQTGTESNPMLVVFDSLDSLPSQKELESDSADNAIGQKSKVLGFYMKKFLFKIMQYNICMVFICHIGKKLSLQGPYESYDGRMSSLKDFTVAGGKAIQFYPSNMIFYRSRITKQTDDLLAKMGIPAGFLVEATTLKAKSFSSNLVVPLIFNALKGFDEYPTRFYNMNAFGWFKGSAWKTLPEYPDDKFQVSTFMERVESDPQFKEKVDISWKNYLDVTYSKYNRIMSTLNDIHQSMDIDSFNESDTQKVMHDFLSEAINQEVADDPLSNQAEFQEESDSINIPEVSDDPEESDDGLGQLFTDTVNTYLPEE